MGAGEPLKSAPLSAEDWLARTFADNAPRRFGTGWISGVLGVVLGLLAVFAVLCLHFPQYLTLPELRSLYPLVLVRLAIDAAILLVLALAGLSLLLRRKKALGLAGLALAALALAMGGGGAELGDGSGASLYLGLDWFVLGTLSTAALFVPLERAFALRRRQGPFRKGWLTDAQYFFLAHALVQLLSVLVVAPVVHFGAMVAHPVVQSAVQALPWVAQFALCVLLADLAQYGIHRAFHALPLLWRFHKVHHSVEVMDWLAGSRLHLVDVIATRGMVLLALVLAGFAESAVYAYLALVSFHAVFIHANFAPRTAWLERWVAMPRFHHWHHGIEPEARDVNFAVHLPVIDRWFGTYHMPEDRWPAGYGVAGERAPEGWLRQFIWPLRRKGA
ncbi:sterol desaturase family protein [Altererythrobacter lauratis]|uniref:Sterol desaturase family protein n=1 Tax=Alteraurantiacibacter lauratis TaxID=2054627 RepID=A0ABV7E9N3_9SPHN